MAESIVTREVGGHAQKTLTVCVVAHSHWDREWYHSAPEFRQKLVALIDALLADADGQTTPFLLDGQAIVLEDYLSVRPERSAQLAERIRAGSIEAGPWYVLADGLIPSGEAIVRNLLTGRRVIRQLGADLTVPAIAYCPDTFGHPAALPAIAHGFGFPLAIVWRGYGGGGGSGDTARWTCASGDSVLLYHLPPDGYEFGSALPVDALTAKERWKSIRETLAPRSGSGLVLLQNGADHHALQPNIRQAILALQEAAMPDTVVRESLSGFAERLSHAMDNGAYDLPTVRGELRDSYGYTWTLNGTFGTRAYQKRDNARAERALLRDVEPWLALAWLHGSSSSQEVSADAKITMAQAPALLEGAWRTLLRAHPHDTLCGCSIDAVARSMDESLSSTMSQARGLRAAALAIAMQHDVVAARSKPVSISPSVVIRNRVARLRGGIAEVVLDETLGDVAVGPSSAIRLDDRSDDATAVAASVDDAFRNLGVVENCIPSIGQLPLQVVRSKLAHRRRESPQHYPDNDLVREHRALVWVKPVQPLGLTALPITFQSHAGSNPLPEGVIPVSCIISVDDSGSGAAGAHGSMAQVELSNGIALVVVSQDGVTITHGNRRIENALTFETCRDAGDSYTPAIRGTPELLKITKIESALRGPLRASVGVKLRSSGRTQSISLTATISLDADADTVRVEIHGINRRRNHRLRVNFNTDLTDASTNIDVHADAAFGPVHRKPIAGAAYEQKNEMVPVTMPMHRWATMTSGDAGATMHSDGLAEVEANTSNGAISLTLLRAIGELSRNNLRERPGHAGWPAPIPLAQSLGTFRAKIALQLHGRWSQQTRDDIEAASDALLLPLTGGTMRDLERSTFEIAGPTLYGNALRTSAVSLAADDNGIVLRCVNDSDETQSGRWEIPNISRFEFALARLDETPLEPWQTGNEIGFTARPRSIVTYRVRRRVP